LSLAKQCPLQQQLKGATMSLLIAYILCLVVGQSITIAIGLSIDRMYSSSASLPVSIVLYFLMFWLCWKIAVRITAPKPPAMPTAPPAPPA
jgi:uncharacterized BrkB/YihY/UPF0761 family membrane protein